MRATSVALALILTLVPFAGCGETTDEKGPTTPPADSPEAGTTVPDPAPAAGKAILEARCTSCHGADKVKAASLSRERWTDQVEMCTSDGPLSSDDAGRLIDYLAEHHGEE